MAWVFRRKTAAKIKKQTKKRELLHQIWIIHQVKLAAYGVCFVICDSALTSELAKIIAKCPAWVYNMDKYAQKDKKNMCNNCKETNQPETPTAINAAVELNSPWESPSTHQPSAADAPSSADFGWDRSSRGLQTQIKRYGFRVPSTAPPPSDC